MLRIGLARKAAEPWEDIVDIAQRLFGPQHGVELDIPPRGGSTRRRPLTAPGAVQRS